MPASLPHDLRSIADKAPLMRRRMELMHAVRAFFDHKNYIEVETPYLVQTPGEEVHLRCFSTILEKPDGEKEKRFLHTSPEFAMKRLVAALQSPIYQFARVWRNGEKSATHHPEFTMLEWYHPKADLTALMDETEDLLKTILPSEIHYKSNTIKLSAPFERLTLEDAFHRYVGADLLGTINDAEALARQAGVLLREGEEWEDLFFRLMLEKIEPFIGREKPTFLTHWPAPQAALSKKDPHDERVALRFELYAGGLELANAFEELTDQNEQRKRFEIDRARRLDLYKDQDWPLDEAFLKSISFMPPCSGIALGFDRLAMLATNAPSIDDLLWLG
ncbi:EF-P lysine aminoacylase GenX [Aristophania vespae]|uniref:EF-P lysine aminoacylase GenX n=1 Tax=Aristophania vespae TaxID=2697033 RepID=A0A6P1NEF6_9PROT|nr:EF-P lysine aminoacylase EpmA [Aristophania vespae]QHI95793.1 EF-P lysine aminoacylase GenX [Aristophania vespae]UMM63499.1 Elongation factor P--(R)-beta-lysine ligase [Aristophania vespae]